MLHRLANRLAVYLFDNHIIQDDDIEVIEYGVIAFVMYCFNFSLVFVSSVFIDKVIESLIMVISFALIRNDIGGFHASKPIYCTISSYLMWLVLIHVPQIIDYDLVYWLLLFISIVIIVMFAPVFVEEKTEEKMKELKYHGYKILMIDLIIIGLGVILKQEIIFQYIILGISLAVSSMMMLKIVQ